MSQVLHSLEVRNRAGDLRGDLLNDTLVLNEFEPGPFRIVPSPPEIASEMKIIVAKNQLKREGHEFIFKGDRGTSGITRLSIQYYKTRLVRQIRYQSTALRENYTIMIDELSRFAISMTLAKGKVLSQNDLDLSLLLEDYESRLDKIAQFLEHFFESFQQIATSPLSEPEKSYVLTRDSNPSQPDLRTIVWRLTHPGNPKQLRSIVTSQYNNAENRLLVMLLNQLKAYLHALSQERLAALQSVLKQVQASECRLKTAQQAELDSQVQDAERKAFKRAQLNQIKQTLSTLAVSITTHTAYEQRIAPLTQSIDHCLRTSFLKDLPRIQTASLTPTLALMREYPYRNIYHAYSQLNQALKLSQTEELLHLVGSFPIERTSTLYEYWVFIQIFLELQNMGFSEAQPGCLLETIRINRFSMPEGMCLELIGPDHLYKCPEADYTRLNLHYEKRLMPTNAVLSRGSLLPDYLLEFPLAQTCFILDAKYRHYSAMIPDEVEPKTPIGMFQHEVDIVAKKKYFEFLMHDERTSDWIKRPGLEQWRRQVAASFIIHSSPEPEMDDYGNHEQGFRYGGISFAPDSINSRYHLSLLLRMLFQVHLKLYDICWPYPGCSHGTPERARHTLKSGKRAPWEGNYHCVVCGNKWWVNHCGHCKESFKPKMTQSNDLFNYYDLDETTYQTEGKTRYYLKCGSCNRSYKMQAT